MKEHKSTHRQHLSPGFTLMEIMISILIISFGLAAMAGLQGKLTRHAAMAKQRTLAMSLAEQQIETMLAFYTMADTGAEACDTTAAGFDDLQSCEAGTTLSVGSLQFDLSWTVEDFIQNADGTTEIYTVESDRPRADLKLVTITVEWQDGRGDVQSFELQDIIDATSVFNTGRLMARVDSNVAPRTAFDPFDFPGVVQIAIGDDKLKGSTIPEPTITNHGTNVSTLYDVVTFLQSGDGAYLQRREEFKILNCICTLDAGLNTGREPTVWDGVGYALGAEVTKRTGRASTAETGQPAACDMCCRDHHDASGANVLYDAFRPAFSGETGSFDLAGDHAHYGIDNGEKVLAVGGDDYLEACRFIRRNGFFRLTTDLSLENLDVVQETYPYWFNEDYSHSVVNFVTDFFTQVNVETYPGVVPDGTYVSDAAGIFLANLGEIKAAVSRGIYLDYMPEDLLKKIKCLKAGGLGAHAAYCDITKDPSWLEILPFHDLDVTSLANWSKGSAAISVTNSPISDIDSASFSRGEISIAQNHFDVYTDVTADIEMSNTGLTDTNPIDPDDEYEVVADIPVTVVIGGNPPAAGIRVMGDIDAGSHQVNVETVRARQDPPVMNCEIISTVVVNKVQKAYRCDLATVDGLANGTVTISDYNSLKVTGAGVTVLNRKVCVDNEAFSIIRTYDDGVMANPDLDIPGEVTVMTFTDLAEDTTINLTIEKENDSCP